jgi:predicted dehydrogenase
VHGAKYFRRWHAQMENSGGLLVHKATHHFDLVNWLLSDEPESVAGFASLRVYGKNGSYRGERCSTCAHAEKCPFVMALHKVEQDKAIFDELYCKAEQEDGYIHDRCLFREEIDIYDTRNAIVRYRGGAQLSYALNASPIRPLRGIASR